MQIQVKVFEPSAQNSSKLIKIRKTKTVRELCEEILNQADDKFCSEGFKIEDMRLRIYDPMLKVMSKAFEDKFNEKLGVNQFDQTLLHQNIHNYIILKVELKNEQGLFEDYKDSWNYLRVFSHDKAKEFKDG